MCRLGFFVDPNVSDKVLNTCAEGFPPTIPASSEAVHVLPKSPKVVQVLSIILQSCRNAALEAEHRPNFEPKLDVLGYILAEFEPKCTEGGQTSTKIDQSPTNLGQSWSTLAEAWPIWAELVAVGRSLAGSGRI